MRHFWCEKCQDISYHVFDTGDNTGRCFDCNSIRDVRTYPPNLPKIKTLADVYREVKGREPVLLVDEVLDSLDEELDDFIDSIFVEYGYQT